MERWEYRVEVLTECEYRVRWLPGQYAEYAHLDKLGNDGWELVAVIIDDGTVMGYFKRGAL